MTDIGGERFSARNDQKHGAEHHETAPTIDHEKFESVDGIDGSKHLRRANDMLKSEQADRHKPDHGDRTEHRTYTGSAARLKEEKPYQNDDSKGRDVVIEQRCGNMQA